MDHITRLLQLVDQHPKHFSQIIKRDPELSAAIGLTVTSKQSIAELVFLTINPTTVQYCDLGNKLKFKSYKDGYGFCGPASSCECAKKSVSKSVHSSKSQLSNDQIERSNQRRMHTNIKKYGVANTGQLPIAKKNHSALYSDEVAVERLTRTIKSTKLARWGNENYNNSSKTKKTWASRQEDYWQERYPSKEISTLYSKTAMQKLFDEYTPDQIATKLNVHVQTVYRYLVDHKLRIPFQSSYEHEMIRILKSWGISNIISGSRNIIPSHKQIDIYLPDHNIAIEMNGVFWHHENMPHISKHYHRNKFIECEQAGIQLITIFSDIWDNYNLREKMLRMIKHRLHLQNVGRIFARKTAVVPLLASTAKTFFEDNHLQGYAPSKLNFGLITETGEIVAAMSFSEPRVGIGKKRPNTIELVRYATTKHVIGGASKLLSYFMAAHAEYNTVISYSNNDWSNGALYQSLGFTLEADLPPSYFYFDTRCKKRMHRYNFAKHKLVKQGFNSDLSESQIQQSRGYLRIWDCGKRTWIKRY